MEDLQSVIDNLAGIGWAIFGTLLADKRDEIYRLGRVGLSRHSPP